MASKRVTLLSRLEGGSLSCDGRGSDRDAWRECQLPFDGWGVGGRPCEVAALLRVGNCKGYYTSFNSISYYIIFIFILYLQSRTRNANACLAWRATGLRHCSSP